MSVVTRFAPSPTGFLHLGGARTALFNWLYARGRGGKFLLRVEDTDRARSTPEATEAILAGLQWLGLDWDGDWVSQQARADRHRALALKLLDQGKAYRCYTTPEELAAMRAEAKAEKRPVRYDGRWRDRDPFEAPAGIDPVIRLKAPQSGETVIEDAVQGRVSVQNAQLDDFILLRADGSPTYMLAVVADDLDMGVTHVIRGDDHLNNAFRQAQLYQALGETLPIHAHIPLIHGPDGAKLSKRHGALGVEAYRAMGYLPEAMRNYLLRLGWGHGDEEIVPTERALALFDLSGVGRAAARFDFDKLASVNAHYLREAEGDFLFEAALPFLEKTAGARLTDRQTGWVKAGLADLKPRAKTLTELAEQAAIYLVNRPIQPDEKAAKLIDPAIVGQLQGELAALPDFTADSIETRLRALAEQSGTKLGKLAQPLRAALCGSTVSPPIFQAAAILGRDEVLARLQDAQQG